MSEQNITSILTEERRFEPSALFTEQARLTEESLNTLHAKAETDNVGFWADLARDNLEWDKPFTNTLDESTAPNYRWFADGELNVSYNCLDRHLERRGGKPAIIFEGEKGDVTTLTYRDLHARVCRFASALKAYGIDRGDRVIIYMPMVPEAVIAMQSCARIGAVHSVVFGGFSAAALRDRIEDTGAKMVITADGGTRGRRIIELKKAADVALEDPASTVQKVIVLKRSGQDVPMIEGRDVWWHDAEKDAAESCAPVSVASSGASPNRCTSWTSSTKRTSSKIPTVKTSSGN